MLTNDEFTRYAHAYIDTVFRVAYHYLHSHSEAEDVTQAVFLKLLQAKKFFYGDDHVKNWLIRVTINECKNVVRSSRWNELPLEEYAAAISYEDQKDYDVFQAVMDLPVKYRIPIYLYYYEGYSTKEIAAILKTPKNTVCTNLKRGRELLKKKLLEVTE